MEIDRKMVEYVAELSKLRLTEPEKELMQQDLSKVLQYMDILNSLPTDEVEPLTHVSGVENVFREDVVTNGDESEKTLKNAPGEKDNMFMVPKTFE